MTKEELIKEHEALHEALDRLTACYIGNSDKNLMETSVMDLIKWSYKQTLDPSCFKDEK